MSTSNKFISNNNKIVLYNDDCMSVMRNYEDNYFDLAVIDPDFGLNEKISQGGTWASKYKGFNGALGVEINEKYFNDTIERFKKHTCQTKLF